MAHVVLVVVVPYFLGDDEPDGEVDIHDQGHTDASSGLMVCSSL